MPLTISNRDARRLWLSAQGLSHTPTGKLDLKSLITSLGFVQLDSIRAVSRAHHHILWSRNQHYREPMLNKALVRDRMIFEHFTHDASVLPMEFYPAWDRQFRRMEEKVRKWEWHRGMLDANGRNALRERIVSEGPLSTEAFDTKIIGKKEMWSRPPHKLALDYMWYAGELSTSHRVNFKKFYDITERVIPNSIRSECWSDDKQIDWLCREAIRRQGFATAGDIQRFWDAVSSTEVKTWINAHGGDLVNVEIECTDGSKYSALAIPDIEERLAACPSPTGRLRILNPFDPVIRDRTRLQRLFGFEYRIEIFVPATKRKWGYYVFPLLEGDRFVGRIEAKADRKAGTLNVLNFWPEAKIKWSEARIEKLDAELKRFLRLAELSSVEWQAELHSRQ
ncbi:MAG: crosslink repair DNA glycosylase YcaQ family protein [Pseudomonadota bacterium]